MTETRLLVVSAEEAGERLDKWLARRVSGLGRRRARVWCEAGRITVNGRVAAKNQCLPALAEVCLPVAPRRVAVADTSGVVGVAFENEFCVVANKPAGIPTAPLDETDTTAFANALLARYPEMAGIGPSPLEPGLIHRLDTGTSGLLVAARTSAAYDALRAGMSSQKIRKEYLAAVHAEGLDDHGLIHVPLGKSAHNARRVVAVSPGAQGARDATTEYRMLERVGSIALVLVEVERALRHQIRAHFASLGCPLVNDELYGAPRLDALNCGRHALHARRVAWDGTKAIPGFDVTAPLANDLRDWLRVFGFRAVVFW